MGTRSIVAAKIDGEVKGRWVQFDGNVVGQDLKKLIARDGRDAVVKTLLFDNDAWRSIDPSQADDHLGHFTNQRVVPGYGEAVIDRDNAFGWFTAPWQFDIEYVWVIEDDGRVTGGPVTDR